MNLDQKSEQMVEELDVDLYAKGTYEVSLTRGVTSTLLLVYPNYNI
jgi:hypothetical protein